MLVTPRIHFYNFFLMFSFENERWNFFRIFFGKKPEYSLWDVADLRWPTFPRRNVAPYVVRCKKETIFFNIHISIHNILSKEN